MRSFPDEYPIHSPLKSSHLPQCLSLVSRSRMDVEKEDRRRRRRESQRFYERYWRVRSSALLFHSARFRGLRVPSHPASCQTESQIIFRDPVAVRAPFDIYRGKREGRSDHPLPKKQPSFVNEASEILCPSTQ
ncbi:hypothetical protein HN011_003888 [Eciton burchellii]|nr:hypothetical protein HN011_003888 [Eciton burchellii]